MVLGYVFSFNEVVLGFGKFTPTVSLRIFLGKVCILGIFTYTNIVYAISIRSVGHNERNAIQTTFTITITKTKHTAMEKMSDLQSCFQGSPELADLLVMINHE